MFVKDQTTSRTRQTANDYWNNCWNIDFQIERRWGLFCMGQLEVGEVTRNAAIHMRCRSASHLGILKGWHRWLRYGYGIIVTYHVFGVSLNKLGSHLACYAWDLSDPGKALECSRGRLELSNTKLPYRATTQTLHHPLHTTKSISGIRNVKILRSSERCSISISAVLESRTTKTHRETTLEHPFPWLRANWHSPQDVQANFRNFTRCLQNPHFPAQNEAVSL